MGSTVHSMPAVPRPCTPRAAANLKPTHRFRIVARKGLPAGLPSWRSTLGLGLQASAIGRGGSLHSHPPENERAKRVPALTAVAHGRPREVREHGRSSNLQARDTSRRSATDSNSWLLRLQKHKPTARLMAVEQLIRIEGEGAFISLASGSPQNLHPAAVDVDDVFPPAGARPAPSGLARQQQPRMQLDPKDMRLVTELVAGVTRLRRALDYTLQNMLTTSLDRLDEPVKHVLRIGLYELLHRELPVHAINEHVNLAKQLVRPEAGSMVNGVLRNVVRTMSQGQLPVPPMPVKGMTHAQILDCLAVAFSHPDWMVDMWLRQYGIRATVHLMRWNNTRPEYGIRLNPSLSMTPAQLVQALEGRAQAEPSEYLPHEFVRVRAGMQAIVSSPWMAAGQVQVQDEAAGMVVAMLDPQPGETLLDACAAPGGKTMFAAARMQGQGLIVAADVSSARLQALASMARKQGVAPMIQVQQADMAAPPAPPRHALFGSDAAGAGTRAGATDGSGSRGGAQGVWGRQYDRVLLDVPCSGLGVLAKRADLRWRRTKKDMKELIRLQARMLNAAAPLVRPGGLLVYSTCSIEAAENHDQVAHFLTRHPEFQAEKPPPGLLPDAVLTAEGFLDTFPPEHRVDGAFAARLRKTDPGHAAHAAQAAAARPGTPGQPLAAAQGAAQQQRSSVGTPAWSPRPDPRSVEEPAGNPVVEPALVKKKRGRPRAAAPQPAAGLDAAGQSDAG